MLLIKAYETKLKKKMFKNFLNVSKICVIINNDTGKMQLPIKYTWPIDVTKKSKKQKKLTDTFNGN